jgi:glycosyltransferase involved in cell wall biosynthesis
VKRVAFVLPRLVGGGAERATLNLIAELSGWDAVILVEHEGGELRHHVLAREVEVIGPARLGRSERIIKLGRALRRHRADLVVPVLSPVVGAAAARAAGVPVLQWLNAPVSTVPYVRESGIRGVAARLAIRRALEASAVAAVATPPLAREWIAVGAVPERLGALANPVPFDEIEPRAPDTVPREEARLALVARLSEEKGHDLALRALAELCRQRPARLLVAGSGPLEARLRRRAGELEVAGHVEWLGFVEDAPGLIRSCDALVVASQYEGLGTVLLEGLACGTPIVATDVPHGPAFVLGGGRFGTLVRPGDPHALAAGIARVLDARPLTSTAIAASRERAAQFATRRVAERFCALAEFAGAPTPSIPPALRTWP